MPPLQQLHKQLKSKYLLFFSYWVFSHSSTPFCEIINEVHLLQILYIKYVYFAIRYTLLLHHCDVIAQKTCYLYCLFNNILNADFEYMRFIPAYSYTISGAPSRHCMSSLSVFCFLSHPFPPWVRPAAEDSSSFLHRGQTPGIPPAPH